MKAEDVRLDFSLDEQKQRLINPIETPQVTQDLSNNVVLTTLNDLYN
ncbi:MAG: NADH-quinone oxidoreductase subunit B, partial [bacterium]